MRILPSLLIRVVGKLKPERRALLLETRIGSCLRPIYRKLLSSGCPVVTISNGVGRGLRWRLSAYANQTTLALGDHEPDVQNWLRDNVEPGDTFIDIGSNLGFMLLIGAKLVGPGGRVVGFEPVPGLRSMATEQLRLNGLAHGQLLDCALGDCPTVAQFCVTRVAHSTSRIIETGTQPAGETILVSVDTLDRLVMSGAVPQPNVIKVDVEGYEHRVLTGARAVLRELGPRLVCEVHDAHSASLVIDVLDSCGYRWQWIDHSDHYPRHLAARPVGT